MKTFTMLFRGLALLVGFSLLVGCAGQVKKLPVKLVDQETGKLVDGYLATTTTGDTLDRSSSFTQLAVDTGRKDEQGKPILKQVSGDLTTGSTVAGQAAVGIVSGTGAAAIQARAARSTAKTKSEAMVEAMKCPDGTTLCHSSVISVGGAQASAGAGASAGAEVMIDAVLGTCPNGNCIPIGIE